MIAVLEETTKICTKCRTEKSTDEFYRDSQKKDDLRPICKDCTNVQQRKYRETDRGKQTHNKGNTKYRQIHKIEIAEHYVEWHGTIEGYLRKLFNGIQTRCINPKAKDYKYYGGRGIECRFAIDAFVYYVMNILGFDIIEKIKGLQIDRIENNGHYESGNIQFVTAKVNANNKRNNRSK